MYVKNSNFVIFLALAVVVGFGVSTLISSLGTQSGLTEGSISKAARYNNQKEDPMATVIEEKLMNDEAFLNNTKEAMGFLQNRMIVLYGLTEKTIEACDGIPEFQPLMIELQSMNAKAFNTAKAISDANDGLDKIVEGEKAPEYESYSNQAFIGFSKVESQMDLGEKFCRIASSFLEGKDEEEYQQIAELIMVWEVYCLQNSQMVADKEHSKPAADSIPDLNPVNVPGMPGGRNPRLTGPGKQVADNKNAVDTTSQEGPTRSSGPIILPFPPKGGPRFGNSAYNEYLNGIAAGEVLEKVMLLGGNVILDAFPGMEAVMNARPIDGAGEIKNTFEQTLNARIEDR